MQMSPSIKSLEGNIEWKSEADDKRPLKKSELMSSQMMEPFRARHGRCLISYLGDEHTQKIADVRTVLDYENST